MQTRIFHQSCLMYREIQVIANMMNELLNGWFMVKLLFAATLLESFCITTTILSISHNEKIYVPLFFGIMGIFTTFAQFFMVKQMASLWIVSEKTFRQLQNQISVRQDNETMVGARTSLRLKRRVFKSCWMIRQKFGIDNFVDRTTPLSTTNIANNLTINFLLIN